jgi:dinuclear metal center YbgI/SA1388 family protein
MSGMATVSDLVAAMESIAPLAAAEDWDNVGLLVGEPRATLKRVVLCIDYTTAVAGECQAMGADAVVAYHPPIFEGVKRLRGGEVVFEAIRAGRAIYSPHTALDVAEGGTNDVLAGAMGLTALRPLRGAETGDSGMCKMVVFVPEAQAEAVAGAMYAAGAGNIGTYKRCSFQLRGTGTFFGSDGSSPSVGQAGRDERVEEVRLELVVPREEVAAVMSAVRGAHPYETPAVDVYPLVEQEAGGMGRVGQFTPGTRASDVVARLKRELGVGHLLVAGAVDRLVRRGACCAGSCGKLMELALRDGVELFVTGEMRHHDALKAAQAGMTVICTLHSNSERVALRSLADRLGRLLPTVEFVLSRQDRDPLTVL